MTGENNSIEIIKIVASILGGGLAGSILTNIISNRRNKIQPVGYEINVNNIFSSSVLFQSHFTKISLSNEDETFQFDNLFISEITIKNHGNKDFTDFEFGITLPENIKIVNLKNETPDRHHSNITSPEINFDKQSSYIDCKLSPFNRKDFYKISLLIIEEKSNSITESFEDEIKFSSKHPIKFIPQSRIGKTLYEVLSQSLTGLSISLLGIRYDFSKNKK